MTARRQTSSSSCDRNHPTAMAAAIPANVMMVKAMKLAESRDMIAKQYVNGFDDLFAILIPELRQQLSRKSATHAIVGTHLFCMATFPDSLIARIDPAGARPNPQAQNLTR